MFRVSYLIAYLMLPLGILYSQIPSHYSYKDDLIGSNTVYNLCEYNHCIYAATENGVVKIDQGKTTVYKNENAVKNSYTQLQIGPDGSLYTLNFRNQIYRVTNEGLKLYVDLREDFSHPIRSFSFLHDYVYVSSNQITLRYLCSNLKKDDSWKGKGAYSEGIVIGDTLFLGFEKITDDSTYFNGLIKRIGQKHQSHARDQYLLYQTSTGPFVAFFSGGIFTERGRVVQFNDYLPDVSNIHYLKALDEKRMWLSSNAGAIIFDPKNNSDVEVIFPEMSISDILIDEQGKIWVGTLGDGIKVIPDVRINYFPSPSIISAFAINEQGTESYIGTESGEIFNLDNIDGKSRHQVNSKIDALYVDENRFYISHLSVNTLLIDGKVYRNKPVSLKSDRIIKVNDLMLFSSWHGVDFSTEKLLRYDSLNLFFQECTYSDSASTRLKKNLSPLWVSTNFDRIIGLQNGRVIAFGNMLITEKIQRKSFADLQIFKNEPFLLTRKGELWSYSVAKSEFQHVFKIKSNSRCQRLAVSDLGYFIYEDGIIHYLSNDSCYSYSGFSRFKYEELIDFKARNNYLYVVYRNGVHRIPISSLRTTFEITNLPLDLFVDGELIVEPNGFSIPAGDHSIAIRFNYFDELLSTDIFYSYQINDGDWMNAESRSQLQLSGLSSGDYEIKIRIDRPAGSPVYKKISFQIQPNWYETIWFYFGITFFVLLLVIYYFLKRIQSIRNRQEMENEIVYARIAKINAQMKPHFIFNVLASIQSMILKENKIQASNAIGEFAEFIRNTLEISKKDSITISEELTICDKYIQLERNRQIREFEYIIDSDGLSNSILKMQIPPLIIQPYVENAIIHGLNHLRDRKGSLRINLEKKGENVCITIIDNGVGRSFKTGFNKETKETHKSFATVANYNRVSLIRGGKIQIVDLDEGTKVIIEIPIEI